MLSLLLLLLSLFLLSPIKVFSGHPPCYYHQVQSYTYHNEFGPKSCDQKCIVAPFVSPDDSLDAHMSMIRDATSSIVIANPEFESWVKQCSMYRSDCDNSKCTGCAFEVAQNESFPVFKALLEAIRIRHISVKVLTNDYSVPTCANKVTMLDWLHVNGADIRMYRSTSFLHTKFMMIDDGKKVLVSSVNFSKGSFKQNREAGVIISNCDCEALDLYRNVFNSDWEEAEMYTLTNSYTKEQLNIIKTATINTPDFDIKSIKDYPGTEIVQTYVAPDYARDTFFKLLGGVQKSLLVHIYEITDKEICSGVVSLHNNGVKVSVLVSNKTADQFLHKKVEECYKNLTDAGISFARSNSKKFTFSHQKYWIVDDKDVHLSTGNWNPSDFRSGYDNKPIPANKYPIYANRDMLIIMRSEDIVNYFKSIFLEDGGKEV